MPTKRSSQQLGTYSPWSCPALDYGSSGIRVGTGNVHGRRTETDPLCSSAFRSYSVHAKSSGISPYTLLLSLTLGLIAFILGRSQGYTYGLNSFYNPNVREAIRIEWEHEKKTMADVRSQWRLQWENEKRTAAKARVDWGLEWENEKRAAAKVRAEWEQEWENEKRAAAKVRAEWELEWENEKQAMYDTRARWAREREEHDEWRRHSRQEREHEEEKKRKEEEREEERKRKEEERQRANIRWDEPTPLEQCHSYGTREYTAQLLNVPRSMNAMKICLETSVVIHGRTLPSPNHCEDRGKWGGVFGHWMVDFDESACQPYWEEFKDKGCIGQGSGLRRYESHLESLYSSNWPEMCSTTPAYINHQYFKNPTHCVDWGKYGIWGIWEVSDHNC